MQWLGRHSMSNTLRSQACKNDLAARPRVALWCPCGRDTIEIVYYADLGSVTNTASQYVDLFEPSIINP